MAIGEMGKPAEVKELITDPGTGQLSHTKLWTNIAYSMATIAFVKEAIFSPNGAEGDIWLIYLGIVGAHNVASKVISMKYGTDNKDAA